MITGTCGWHTRAIAPWYGRRDLCQNWHKGNALGSEQPGGCPRGNALGCEDRPEGVRSRCIAIGPARRLLKMQCRWNGARSGLLGACLDVPSGCPEAARTPIQSAFVSLSAPGEPSALPIRSRGVLRRGQCTCRRPAPRLPRPTCRVRRDGMPQASSMSRALSGEAPGGGKQEGEERDPASAPDRRGPSGSKARPPTRRG